MKWFTFPGLLAVALFSAVVVIPFLPAAKNHRDVYWFEAHVASSVPGTIKIYYDIGQGYIEAHGSEQVLAQSDTPQLYRLVLPGGEYRSIRFDPLDGPGAVTIAAPVRIVSETGRTVRTIGLAELKPLQQIESARESGGRLHVVAGNSANDPQLRIMFSPWLTLAPAWSERLVGFPPRVLGVFATLAVLLFLLDRAAGARARAAAGARWLAARPARAVAFVAAVAVIASAYPVVFLGKSYVSPNFGTTLLYEAYPTLPGYTDPRTWNANGSDVGAAMWADVPYSFMQHRALAHGELPLWNRYAGGGVPLLAQGQSMFGDPLHWLVVLCDGAAWAWDLKFLIAKWLFAVGLGLLVLAVTRDQETKRPRDQRPEGPGEVSGSFGPLVSWSLGPLVPALLVALTAPFIGFYVVRINHPAVFSLGYAPWVLLCWIRLARTAGRRATAGWLAGLFGANLGLLASGTAKEAAILLGVMNLTGAALLLVQAAPWRMRLVKLAGATWTGALLLLISAPVWATFLRGLRDAFTGSGNPAAAQIQPALLLGAFDELFFRPLSQGEMVFNPSLNLFLLSGLLYFLATIRLHFGAPAMRVLIAATVVCMAFVFGLVPIAWIVQVPFLGNIGHIEMCFLCALLVLWSILAGVGFATAAERLRTTEGRGDLAIVAAWLCALIFAWLAFRQVSHRDVNGPGSTFSVLPQGRVIPVEPFVWNSLAASVTAIAGLALVARHAAMRSAPGAGRIVLGILCGLVLCWRHGMHDFSVGFETYVVHPPTRVDFRAKSPAIELLRARHQAEPTRVFGLHGTLTPNWNVVYGLEAIYGVDALQNRWVRELIDAAAVPWSSAWRVYLPTSGVARARPLLDALNVRYYVDMPGNPSAADATVKRIHSSDLAIYESATAWPRAFFTDRLDTYDTPADLIAKFAASNGRPFAAVHPGDLAAHTELSGLPSDVAARTVTPARNYHLAENQTAFDLHAPGPGMVVLQEGWWPSAFRVELNGRRVPVVRVNHAFKGAFIPAAGDYRVTFSYWPKNFTLLLTLCAVGTGLGVLSLALALRPVGRQKLKGES